MLAINKNWGLKDRWWYLQANQQKHRNTEYIQCWPATFRSPQNANFPLLVPLRKSLRKKQFCDRWWKVQCDSGVETHNALVAGWATQMRHKAQGLKGLWSWRHLQEVQSHQQFKFLPRNPGPVGAHLASCRLAPLGVSWPEEEVRS